MTIQVFWYMVNRSPRFGRTSSTSVTKQELFISPRRHIPEDKESSGLILLNVIHLLIILAFFALAVL